MCDEKKDLFPTISEEKDKILDAYFKLQEDLPTVAKKTTGHNYKYATLDEIMTVLKPILIKHDLMLTQPLNKIDGQLHVMTYLYHKSGQFMSCVCPCEVNTSDRMSVMQRIGSAITYARRYSLSLLNLLTDEDTDDLNNRPDFKSKAKTTTAAKTATTKTGTSSFSKKKTGESKWS